MIHFVCLLQVKGFTSCKQWQVVPSSGCEHLVLVLSQYLRWSVETSGMCCAVLMYSAAICDRSIHCNYCLLSNSLLHLKFKPSSDVVLYLFFLKKKSDTPNRCVIYNTTSPYCILLWDLFPPPTQWQNGVFRVELWSCMQTVATIQRGIKTWLLKWKTSQKQ